MVDYVSQDPTADPIIESILRFSTNLCNADAGIFYWTDEGSDISCVVPFRAPASMLGAYDAHTDPLNIVNLAPRKVELAFLSQEDVHGSSKFARYLHAHGFCDEVDLVFWNHGKAIGGLALYRPNGCAPFCQENYDWHLMRKHFEVVLRAHDRVRTGIAKSTLRNCYNISSREQQVLHLMACGASNSTISESLGIGIPTVKTHVVNILGKLGVESRSAAVALALGAQLHPT